MVFLYFLSSLSPLTASYVQNSNMDNLFIECYRIRKYGFGILLRIRCVGIRCLVCSIGRMLEDHELRKKKCRKFSSFLCQFFNVWWSSTTLNNASNILATLDEKCEGFKEAQISEKLKNWKKIEILSSWDIFGNSS